MTKSCVVLVASRVVAKLFDYSPGKKTLKMIAQMEHPEGHLKNSELKSDRPGSTTDSVTRHQLSSQVEPKEQVLKKFIAEVAERLYQDIHAGHYGGVVIIAEPHLLGVVRAALAGYKEIEVIASIPKDLASLNENDLMSYVSDIRC